MIQFSIVIPFYNEAKKLPALLKSIKELDFNQSKAEFIFVSNNSTDESDSIITRSGHQLQFARKLRSSYYARNIGLSAATGDYVVFVDADCILDKGLLNSYANYINKHKECGPIIYAGDIQPAVKKGCLIENYSTARRVLNQKSAATGWAYKPFAQTANAMFARRDLIRINGFNENMTSGGDAEICWRLAEVFGHRVIHCEEAIVYHQHRDTVEDLINQFIKYGRGRFQQTLVSETFAKEKKPDDLDSYIERTVKLVDELVAANCPEETLYKVLDSFVGFYLHLGFIDEMTRVLNRRIDGENYMFISAFQKQFELRESCTPGELSVNNTAPANAPLINNTSSICNICGGMEFKPGPNGRISNGKMPMCSNCGSLERHRAIFQCYESFLLKIPSILNNSRALQFAKDVSIKPEWFSHWDYSEYGGHNSLDVMKLSLQDKSVDWFILNHILEHVPNDKIAISELARALSNTGVMQITVPSPLFSFETIDWGYPDPKKILHYREYGADLIPRVGAICREIGLYGLVAIPTDPVSAVSEAVIFITKDIARCKDMFNALKSCNIPSIRIN